MDLEQTILRLNLCAMSRVRVLISMPIAFLNPGSCRCRRNSGIRSDQQQWHRRTPPGMAFLKRNFLQLPRLNCLGPLDFKPAVLRRFLPVCSGSKLSGNPRRLPDFRFLTIFNKGDISYETESKELDNQNGNGARTRRWNRQFRCPTGIRGITRSSSRKQRTPGASRTQWV